MVELALRKYPEHSSSPVLALTELYKNYVRPFGERMEQLLEDPYSVAILHITEEMTKPDVVSAMECCAVRGPKKGRVCYLANSAQPAPLRCALLIPLHAACT